MKNKFKLMIVGIFCLMAIVGIASASLVDPPTVIPGSSQDPAKTCAVQISGSTEVKIEAPLPTGTTLIGTGLTMTKPSVSDGEESFDFTSQAAVLGVIVKNGNTGANFYDYRPLGGVTADIFLQAPPDGDKQKGISNIHFCFGPGTYPPPPPPNVPEFPTVALPVGMLIGLVGLVYFVRTRE